MGKEEQIVILGSHQQIGTILGDLCIDNLTGTVIKLGGVLPINAYIEAPTAAGAYNIADPIF